VEMGLPRARWWHVCHFALTISAASEVMADPDCDDDVCVTKVDSLIQLTSSQTMDPTTCTEAVLVEMRNLSYTGLALQSALGVPGIDLITLAHGEDNADFTKRLLEGNTGLDEAHQRGAVRLLQLPFDDLGADGPVEGKRPNMQFSLAESKHHLEYSGLFLTPDFWKLFQCDRIFIFQSDTVFCRNTAANIKEFAEYPYIGAHTPTIDGAPDRIHMNGGFSLRSRPDMIRCIEKDNADEVQNSMEGEDEIFSRCRTLKQPPVSVADRFGIDNGFKVPIEPPLGPVECSRS